ncbi:hypothetical protein [Serratia liquefaciens]|uniref:hypothetical protein n=1 Tax=Serratia liquefaciens TaxID=614 RepID=UPI0022B95466|nr:hypothetical protein [Serratia liquefaciens]
MRFPKVALFLALFISSGAYAQKSIFICGDNTFTAYFNASLTKISVVINDELTENADFDEYSYGELGDSFVMSFDVWGANGGMHNHYTTIFPKKNKEIRQVVQLLDADNRPRGDAITKKCTRKS